MIENKLKFIFQFFDEKKNNYFTPKMMINNLKVNEIPVDEANILEIFKWDENKEINFELFRKLMN